MAASSHDKDDLSVDNVHTPFGLTKRPPGKSPYARNESKPRPLTTNLEVMLRSVPLPMKRCRTTTTYPTNQERTT